MKLTDLDVIQGITDVLAAFAIALSKHIDPVKLADDLSALADEARQKGEGPSAGLIEELVKGIKAKNLH